MSALIPLRAYLFRYKAALLGGFLFILAANIVALALPYLIRLAVDSLQTGVNTGLLLRYGLLIVVVDLLQMSHFVVSTPDLDSAYRIFSVLNDRGLDLTDLERLAAGLMVIRANVNKRIERYARLLTAIENNNDLYTSNSPLQLTDEERRDIVTYLDANLYESGFCKYVLLRLDESFSDGEASYNYASISVEHVLPQNPLPNSEWVQWFPDQEERKRYVHRLGNLVLLSRKKNSQAQNYDFLKKKKIYFSTGNSIVSFALTTQVIQQTTWTPEVIEQRQHHLMSKLKDIWRL